MFDGLRNDAANSSDFDAPADPFVEEQPPVKPPAPPRRRSKKTSKRILGMTPVQRFMMSVMIMIATCLLGAMCLLITGKFVLPF